MNAKRARADDDRLVDALRQAKAPIIVGAVGTATRRAHQAAVQTVVADLVVLVAGAPNVRMVRDAADVERILEEAAFDVEARLEIATGNISRRIETGTKSTYDLTQIAIEEAEACGLSQRHGVRLALEAVLGSDAREDGAVKDLAAAVHDAAAGPRPVASVLALLDDADRTGERHALNVVSVLCFGEALQSVALEEWRSQQPSAIDGRLQPLIAFYQLPPADDDVTTAHDQAPGGDEDELAASRRQRDGAAACNEAHSDCETAVAMPSASLWQPVALDPQCTWAPAAVVPTLCAELGSSSDGVVVLDGLVSEDLRAELLDLLIGDSRMNGDADGSGRVAGAPPSGTWERTTLDGAGLPVTWGLKPRLLRRLATHPPACVVEVQSRLARLYPEYHIGRISPSAVAHLGRGLGAAGDAGDAGRKCSGEGSGEFSGGGGEQDTSDEYSATPFVANAAVYGNAFQWHVDADPSSLPPSRWLSAHGDYANGQAGKPLLVSLLVYLDPHWQRDWDAETLFLDDERGVGLLVQPRPARAVLMHADVLHRVSTPSLTARRPRYSLVWKLVFVPKDGVSPPRVRETVCRAEWGAPVRVG